MTPRNTQVRAIITSNATTTSKQVFQQSLEPWISGSLFSLVQHVIWLICKLSAC